MKRYLFWLLSCAALLVGSVNTASAAVTAKLNAEVILDDNTPVKDATIVCAFTSGGRGREFTTNKKGKVFAPFVDVGEYAISVNVDGYFLSKFVVRIRNKAREIEMNETRTLGPGDSVPPVRFKADRDIYFTFTLSKNVVVQPTDEIETLSVPARLKSTIQDIKDLFLKEDYDKALSVIDNNLADYPEEASLFYLKGLVFNKKQRYEEAIPLFQKVLEIDGSYPDANYYLGEAYTALGDDEKAAEAYGKELGLNESNMAILLKLGMLEKKLKQYEKAIAHVQKLIELAPTDNRFKFELAEIYAAQGKAEEAQKLIDSLDMAGEHDANSEFNLGVSFWNSKNFNLALNAFKKAAEFDPTMAVAFRQAGLCHVSLNEPKEAIPFLEKYLSLKPDAEDAGEMKDLIAKLKKAMK